jgi:hypothetical protein
MNIFGIQFRPTSRPDTHISDEGIVLVHNIQFEWWAANHPKAKNIVALTPEAAVREVLNMLVKEHRRAWKDMHELDLLVLQLGPAILRSRHAKSTTDGG